MTINEHDRVSTGQRTDAFRDAARRPRAGRPAQRRRTVCRRVRRPGRHWLENLEELVSSAGIESELSEIVGEAALLLEPVARELVVVRPIGFEPMQWVRALAADEPLPTDQAADHRRDLGPGHPAGPDGRHPRGRPPGSRPVRHAAGRDGRPLAGHHRLRGAARRRAPGTPNCLRMLQLIGAAGSLVSRRRGMVGRGDKSPMVSVTNADPDRIAELLEDFSTDVRTVLPPVLSIRNGRRSVVITGTPEQLARFELYCSKITEKEEAERKNKLRGGAVFSPVFHGVQVEVGFHTPRLADGVDMVDGWAAQVRHRRRRSPALHRGHLRRAHRLGRRGRAAARRRRPLDRRPRPQRHHHPGHRAGDPRARHRHRPRRHPRRAAQPVHRRRRPRGRRPRGRATRRRSCSCPTAR